MSLVSAASPRKPVGTACSWPAAGELLRQSADGVQKCVKKREEGGVEEGIS